MQQALCDHAKTLQELDDLDDLGGSRAVVRTVERPTGPIMDAETRLALLREAFAELDVDGAGYLTPQNILVAMQTHASDRRDWCAKDASRIVNRMDVLQKDGVVSFHEVERATRKNCGPQVHKHRRHHSLIPRDMSDRLLAFSGSWLQSSGGLGISTRSAWRRRREFQRSRYWNSSAETRGQPWTDNCYT